MGEAKWQEMKSEAIVTDTTLTVSGVVNKHVARDKRPQINAMPRPPRSLRCETGNCIYPPSLISSKT